MKRIVVGGIVVLIIVLLVGVAVSSKKGPVSSTIKPIHHQGPSDDFLPAARETLQKEPSYLSCRKALQQLNTYIDRNPNKRPEPVPDAQAFQKQFGLAEGEFAEVNSATFTLLDAHYVDLCMLLRDAAYSLGVEGQPPLERAQVAFRWVVRQIQLREPARPLPFLTPTQFVLRRGWGSSLERSVAFLTMLQQMGVSGCMIAYPEGGALHPWIPGAVVDKEVFLFDTRMGIPLPAPDGEGVATLRQIRASDKPFAALTMDSMHSYDMTPEQVRHAEILLTVPLSALATRMKFLDSILGSRQKLRSFVDGTALQKEFQTATDGQNVPIHFWGETGDRAAPMRSLRNFMPGSEGGIDSGVLMQQMQLQLVPGFSIPRVIQEQAGTEEFGRRLANVFWAPFGDFFMDPHGPRELVLRGQLDEASIRLTQAPAVLRFREALFSMLAPLTNQESEWVRQGTRRLSLVGLEELNVAEPPTLRVRRWCDRAFVAYTNFLNAGDTAREAASNIFREGEDDLNSLFLATIKKPLVAEANYQIGLCFHEKAIRLQNNPRSQVAWQAAATKWYKYLEVREDFAKPAISQAHWLRAEALRVQGDVPAAIAELKEPVSGLTNLEEIARLYQIRQLQKK